MYCGWLNRLHISVGSSFCFLQAVLQLSFLWPYFYFLWSFLQNVFRSLPCLVWHVYQQALPKHSSKDSPHPFCWVNVSLPSSLDRGCHPCLIVTDKIETSCRGIVVLTRDIEHFITRLLCSSGIQVCGCVFPALFLCPLKFDFWQLSLGIFLYVLFL